MSPTQNIPVLCHKSMSMVDKHRDRTFLKLHYWIFIFTIFQLYFILLYCWISERGSIAVKMFLLYLNWLLKKHHYRLSMARDWGCVIIIEQENISFPKIHRFSEPLIPFKRIMYLYTRTTFHSSIFSSSSLRTYGQSSCVCEVNNPTRRSCKMYSSRVHYYAIIINSVKSTFGLVTAAYLRVGY